MAEINIYQNPGQSLANIYKGFARQCNPGFVFPEAQTIEAWDIPLKLHPEFVPGGDISKADQQYSTLLAQELANGVPLVSGWSMKRNVFATVRYFLCSPPWRRILIE